MDRPDRTIARRYDLELPIGEGGMGTVYRARDRQTGAHVALKLLHDGNGAHGERFTREATVLASVRHPGIVHYLDHGVTPSGERYLVMEWLEGETLDDRLARGPLTAAETTTLGRRVLEALAAIHRRGIVHRDIKPANLFLVDRDVARVKVLDFGLAKPGFDAGITRGAVVVGTPVYMSPEQLRGDADLDARTDIFAVGCVLHECLTGQAHTAVDAAIAEAPRPGVPDAIEQKLREMLAVERGRRAADAAALARAFAELEGEGGRAGGETLATIEQRVHSVVVVSCEGDVAAATDGAQLRVVRVSDGISALWPATAGTPKEQAVAAADAALSVRARLPAARLAVVTGRTVMANDGVAADLIAAGTRMVHAASGGAVTVDESTARLVDTRFLLDERPGAAAVLLGHRAQDEAPRTVLGKTTSLVGRDRELSILEGLFAESVAEPAARAAIVVSPAGGGKSRLRHELTDRLRGGGERFELLRATGEALRAGAPFGLVGSALRRAAGIVGDEPLAERQRLLSARIARHVPAESAARVTEFLGEMAGVPFPESTTLRAAHQDPRLMADQLRAAALDWLEAEVTAQPVLFVVEDFHWGDRPSVELLSAALRTLAARPFVVLAFSRPELEERYPNLWDEHHVQRISLRPLGKKSCIALARQVLGELDGETEAWLLERSEGNPFYLEELLRAVAAGGRQNLPDTVAGMVQARFDTYGDGAKVVLRAASVFGAAFPRAGVEALVPGEHRGDVDGWLDLLVRREVVFTRDGTGGREYEFRHALLHDAAYDMLPPEARMVGHRAAGDWLERTGHTEAIVLAQHFERGAELARAALWCQRAAAQSLEANDLREAIDRGERAIGLGAIGEVRALSRVAQAHARVWLGEYTEAEASAREAVALLPPGTEGWLSAVAEELAALGQQAKFDDVERLVRGVLVRAPASVARQRCLLRGASYLVPGGRIDLTNEIVAMIERENEGAAVEPAVAARLFTVKDWIAALEGSTGKFVEYLEAALAAAEQAGDARTACEIMVNLGTALGELGQYDRAADIFGRAHAAAERLELETVRVAALLNLGPILAAQGRVPEAFAAVREAQAFVRKQGDPRYLTGAELYLSTIAFVSGDLDESLRAATAAREIAEGVPPLLPSAFAVLARALLAKGRLREALVAAREAHDRVTATGSVEEYESLVRVVLPECLAACGDLDAAATALREAYRRLMERANAIPRDDWRQSFLRLPDNLRTLGLARALRIAPSADGVRVAT